MSDIIVSRNLVYDTTAREGRQCPWGYRFSHEFSVELAERLERGGVYRQELGSPAAHPHVKKSIEEVADSLGDGVETWVHIRCHTADVSCVPENVKGVGLYFGTSNEQIKNNHGKQIYYIVSSAKKTIKELKERGYNVRFTAEDATRTELKVLLGVYRELRDSENPPDVFGVADTVGAAEPNQVRRVLSILGNELETQLEWHGHDDRGFADANAYEAVLAGASSVQVCVGGIGERNGIASLNSFILNLMHLNEERASAEFNILELGELEEWVLKELGIPANYRSSISEYVSTDMAGVHQNGTGVSMGTYHAIDLVNYGYSHTTPVNHPLTGRHAVGRVCENMGLSIDEDRLAALTTEIKGRTFRWRRDDPVLSEDDVADFIKKWVDENGNTD